MCIYLVCFNLKFLILFHVFSLRLDVSFGEISEHIQLDEELQHCLQKLHHHLQFRVWKLGVVSEQFLHFQKCPDLQLFSLRVACRIVVSLGDRVARN